DGVWQRVELGAPHGSLPHHRDGEGGTYLVLEVLERRCPVNELHSLIIKVVAVETDHAGIAHRNHTRVRLRLRNATIITDDQGDGVHTIGVIGMGGELVGGCIAIAEVPEPPIRPTAGAIEEGTLKQMAVAPVE